MSPCRGPGGSVSENGAFNTPADGSSANAKPKQRSYSPASVSMRRPWPGYADELAYDSCRPDLRTRPVPVTFFRGGAPHRCTRASCGPSVGAPARGRAGRLRTWSLAAVGLPDWGNGRANDADRGAGRRRQGDAAETAGSPAGPGRSAGPGRGGRHLRVRRALLRARPHRRLRGRVAAGPRSRAVRCRRCRRSRREHGVAGGGVDEPIRPQTLGVPAGLG